MLQTLDRISLRIWCNKDSYRFSFYAKTLKDWNKLPVQIASSFTIDSFCEMFLDTCTLASYQLNVFSRDQECNVFHKFT